MEANDKPQQRSWRAILHVDMDAFYASIEMFEFPELRGKPVIVGGIAEKRGVVAAASYEVRKFGVHSAMSSYRAQKLCPDAIFVPPRMGDYVEYSKRIFTILREYTPLVEPLSIDEAFMDVTGSRELFGKPSVIARDIKRRIKEEVGLTASVGVAPNKFLAKIASDLEKPDGLVIIQPNEAASRIAKLPVGKMWGVGKVSQRELERVGVTLIEDLVKMPAAQLEGIVGSSVHRLRELAQGVDERPVRTGDGAKSVGAETTFEKDIANADHLRNLLDGLSTRVAQRLRSEGYRAHTIQLKARYADFTTVTRAVTLPEATASTREIIETARDLLDTRLDRQGRALRLIGVSTSNLVHPAEGEPELFPDREREREEKVDHVVDDLQSRFGSGAIWRGSKSSYEYEELDKP